MTAGIITLCTVVLVIFFYLYSKKKNRYTQLLYHLLAKGYLSDEDEEELNNFAKSIRLNKSITDKIRIYELNKATQPIIYNIMSSELFSPEDERKLLTIAYNHRINVKFEDPAFNIYRTYWARSQYKSNDSYTENKISTESFSRINNKLSDFSLPLNIDFLALDVETANEAYSSICQIGIAAFYNNQVSYTWVSLINPECNFINSYIHGISEDDTINSPKFLHLYESVLKKIAGYIVVHHTHFDKSAINQACQKYSLDVPNIRWLDSSRIARHTWENVRQKGYGLSDLADTFNIKFNHHDALEDARIAGLITLKAINESGININDWLYKAMEPITNKVKTNSNSKSKKAI